MMNELSIPFTKAHGAGNDFLLTWRDRVPSEADLPTLARAICKRHEGIGADGWILVEGHAIRIFNADGSEPAISGNGTRCAAAFLHEAGAFRTEITIQTGAGPKHLHLLETNGRMFLFEMNMGQPRYRTENIDTQLNLSTGIQKVALVDVGNPQCVVFCDVVPPNWREIGAEIETHERFPDRTNVSFMRVLDQHTLDVVFFERGVGETMSSGTGCAGAAVAAISRGFVSSPVVVETPAGQLRLRWDDSVYLTGPAVITAAGDFFYSKPI